MPNDGRCREFGRCRADFSCSMTIEEYFETSPSLPLSYSGILWASEVHTRPMLCRLLQSARNLLSFVHAPGPAFVASSHARPSCPPPLLQLERAFVRTALRSRAIAHALREAPAPAHCALARRAQMCLRQGHPGPGGSSEPLDACGAEYHAGIFDEQVRPPFPCTPLASPIPPRPHTNPDRADPPLSTAAALVPRNCCMGAKLLARRAALHFVLLCRGRVVTSKRMRCVQLRV